MDEPERRLTRESIRGRLARRALIDPGFRERLNANPSAAAIELGITLPPEVTVEIIDESLDELRVVVASADTRVDGLNPLMMRIDPAVDRIVTAHLRSGAARLRVGTTHITDAPTDDRP